MSSPHTNLLPAKLPRQITSKARRLATSTGHSPTANQPPDLQILSNLPLHTPTIMFLLPQIIHSRPPRPFLRPLHDLDTLDIRAIDLHPHLRSHSPDTVSEQNCGVRSTATDREQVAGKRIPGGEGAEENVKRLGGVGVIAGEEAGARGGRVKVGDCG